MKHAHVNLGEYSVPLIGIKPSATEQECSVCHRTFHLSEIKLDGNGNPRCKDCTKEIVKCQKEST